MLERGLERALRAGHLGQRRGEPLNRKMSQRGENAEGCMDVAVQEKPHDTLLKQPRIW